MKSTKKDIIRLDHGTVVLTPENILCFNPNGNLPGYNLNQLKKMLEAFKKITKGKRYPYYSDNTQLEGKFTSEAKIFMSNHFHEFATAFAMKEDSPLIRYVTHTFIYLNKPKIPIRMFKTEKEAINWLKNYNYET